MSRFQSVDSDDNSKDLIAYLDELSGLSGIRAMREVAFRLITDQSPGTALDLGCGLGDTADLLLRICGSGNVIGVDSSDVLLRVASMRHPQVAFIKSDISDLSDVSGCFDICYAERVLMHVPHLRPPLAAMMDKLAPGACFVSVEPWWRKAELVWQDEGGPRDFLSSYVAHIAQPDAPEEIKRVCERIGLMLAGEVRQSLVADTFADADQIIRFSNALRRRRGEDADLEGEADDIRARFVRFSLPFVIQVWRKKTL
jgi:ubiquinone/menaquinone biosynthesis C-methylase UbiE